MDILDLTKEYIKTNAKPRDSWCSQEEPFDFLIFGYENEIHDSGFGCFVIYGTRVDKENQGYEITKLSECSDVLEIDGIGGYGDWRIESKIPECLPIRAWKIDCLPCGYFRIWCKGKITVDSAVSSFAFYGGR